MEGGELSLVFEAEGDPLSVASLDKSEVSDYSGDRREASFHKCKHYRSLSQGKKEKTQTPSLRTDEARDIAAA